MKILRNHLVTLLSSAAAFLGSGAALAQTTIVPPTVSIYAGSGAPGYTGDGGPATSAEINLSGLAVDSSGNVYLTDGISPVGYSVRKITTAGVISTVAGGMVTPFVGPGEGVPEPGAGPALGFPFYNLSAITIANGNIYVANPEVDVINAAGTLTPDYVNIADDLASDSNGNVYGILNNSAIFKYSQGLPSTIIAGSMTATGVTTGDGGPALNATFADAEALAVDAQGNIYVLDPSDNIVRKFAPGGNITTIAGNRNSTVNRTSGPPPGDGGPAIQAPLALIPGNGTITVDNKGNIYFVEQFNHIRVVSASGIIQTYAGNGSSGRFLGNNGAALQAVLTPVFVAVDSSDNLFVGNNPEGQMLILKITPQTTTMCTGSSCTTPPPTGPTITGVISAAADVVSVTPGGFASIYGTNLAPAGVSQLWTAADFIDNALPTMLDNVSVTIDGKAAGVNYVSPGQINVVVPDDTTVGPVNVIVTNSLGVSAAFSVPMTAYSPTFFTLDGTHVIAQSFPSYSLVAPTSFGTGAPVAAGSTVIIYGTGFGSTTPPTPSNVLVAAAAPLANPVSVTVGGMPATVLYAGINSIGLYQLNVTLPAGLASGDQPIVATVGNAGSQVSTQATAVIPIQ